MSPQDFRRIALASGMLPETPAPLPCRPREQEDGQEVEGDSSAQPGEHDRNA